MALTALTTLPDSLLTPAAVQARLHLPDTDLAALTEVVQEASGLVIRYLRFDPRYGSFRETFASLRSERIYLGARPLVELTALADYAGTAIDVGIVPHDDAAGYLWRSGGWSFRDDSTPWGGPPLLNISGGLPGTAWDWTVTYRAGWWCETHAVGEPVATKPADVALLPAEIRRDVIMITRWLWGQESGAGTLGIKRMKDEGSEVEFFSSDEADAETGIPINLTLGLALWRKPL